MALDLFTAMECVFNQPADFGLTNVIQARPQGADAAKYLFDLNDDIHFGQRGQELIRQVMQYYLTRGWDWSNTDKDPAKARQKLVTDLEGRESVRRHPLRPLSDRGRRGELTGIAAWRDAVVWAKSSWEALMYRHVRIARRTYGELTAIEARDLFVGAIRTMAASTWITTFGWRSALTGLVSSTPASAPR